MGKRHGDCIIGIENVYLLSPSKANTSPKSMKARNNEVISNIEVCLMSAYGIHFEWLWGECALLQ